MIKTFSGSAEAKCHPINDRRKTCAIQRKLRRKIQNKTAQLENTENTGKFQIVSPRLIANTCPIIFCQTQKGGQKYDGFKI